MSDQQEQQAPASAPTPGAWLRQERERQGRTVQQIATELHIGAYMIDAIETNQFSVLGAPVFARGHLRKYAALLGLPVDRVQELYQLLGDQPRDQDPVPAMHREAELSIPMSPDSKQRRTLQRPAQWTFAIASGALVLAGLAAWLLFATTKPDAPSPAVDLPEDAPTAPEADVAPTPSASSVASSTMKPVDTSKTGMSRSSASSSSGVARTPTPPLANTAPTTALVRGKVRLRFSFNQESWVEVYDARGTRMLYDVGFAGQTRGVDVDPPAQIVLGLASAVSTEVNGSTITVPARRVVNQVARFTVGADGSAE